MTAFEYTIKDELGIHARPAGVLVKTAKATGCKVTIEKGEKSADASRLLAVMGMGIKQGDSVKVTCEGENEAEASEKLKAFFEENL